MAFPASPILDDIHSISGNDWIWNGYAWDKVVTGGTGGTPSSYVISINGISGAVGITAGTNINIIQSGNTYSIRLSPDAILDCGQF